MFRMWKARWFTDGFALLMDAPGAAGDAAGSDPVNGGAGDSPAGGDVDAGDEGDPEGQHASGADPDDDEDEDDPDTREDGEWTPERIKKVTTKLKKLQRRDRRFAPTRSRLAELRERGVSLDDVLYGHRQYGELSQQIARNPNLRKLVTGDIAAEEREETRAPAEPDFDEAGLPFDPNENPTNRYFADLAKSNHELRRELKKLAGRIDSSDGRDAQRIEGEERRTWKGAIDAAAGTIKDEQARMWFKDAMVLAYQDRGKHRRTPQQMIAHYLKSNASPNQARAANTAAQNAGKRTAATQQRIAEQNKNLPRTAAPPGGSPAPARQQRESLAEVRKRLTGRAR